MPSYVMQSVLCSEFNPVFIDPTELMETGVDGWRREEGGGEYLQPASL